MGGYILSLLFFILVNLAVSFLVSMFVPNYYLASIITSVIIAFIYAIFSFRSDRKHFYQYPQFWTSFFIMGLVFLVLDLVSFII